MTSLAAVRLRRFILQAFIRSAEGCLAKGACDLLDLEVFVPFIR